MIAPLHSLNALLEDSCVLVAVAYLLTRGKLLWLLSATRRSRQESFFLGGIFLLIGALQELVPDARYPYVAPSLIVTFAALSADTCTALMATAGVCGGILLLRSPMDALFTLPAVLLSLAVPGLLRGTPTLRRAFFAGALAQLPALALSAVATPWTRHPFHASREVTSVLANGIGVLLLMLVVREAQLRAESERHRHEVELAAVEIEQARTLMAEAQLTALRARINPHFLYNTLSSIAALCRLAPEKAERSIVRLGELMRRTLENDGKTPVALSEELTAVRAYLEIEETRLGGRFQAVWQVEDAALSARIPPLSLLTLLENAVLHGIAPRRGPGVVTITLRRAHGHILLAVRDDGCGMDPETCRRVVHPQAGRPHGLTLVNQQLQLLYGAHSRLRLFSTPGRGTLVAICLPETRP